MLKVLFFSVLFATCNANSVSEIKAMFKIWANELGEQLFQLGMEITKREQVEDNEERWIRQPHVPCVAENREEFKNPEHFRRLPLSKHPQFEDPVNLNYSIIKVSKSIYYREEEVLNDVCWSEPLDLVFKENLNRDPTLIWQYFASTTGFMRLYPAVQWSEETYDQTYDFRLRNWYSEAITSPKDIIILLDRSGSMYKFRSMKAKQIVNNILDTLADNDYVNVYTFANDSRPLVECFNETLMQAHEENLRLLRESLGKYREKSMGNVTVALKQAFELLAKVRRNHAKENSVGTNCNQAIMLITEGIDYEVKKEIFESNKPDPVKNPSPVRVFTFLIDTDPSDARKMEEIACTNMGYYVNISSPTEIREKVLQYVHVMSRPLNLNRIEKPDPVWAGTYIDLTDRRLANWLWTKVEGNRQRDIFLDYTKRAIERGGYMYTWDDNILLKRTHKYEVYRQKRNYTYVTTVALPIYDLRPNSSKVLGAAAVDIPISYIKANLMSYRIGVNGYAFIVTNNGLIVVHPDHRTEFQNIPKPTFNRVDITEVELMDDDREPRDFHEDLLKKRVIFSRRHYYYTGIGPFSLVVAIPDKYGFARAKYNENIFITQEEIEIKVSALFNSANWKIHPEWLYCKNFGGTIDFGNPENEMLYVIRNIGTPGWRWPPHCNGGLMNLLIDDAFVTKWFEDYPVDKKALDHLNITVIFLATHSGLTRWKVVEADESDFQEIRAIDEVWYKRAVDYYNLTGRINFVYSVPFESLGFDNSTPVTVASAIFREVGSKKAPVAVVGYQFHHGALYELYVNITSTCDGEPCALRCGSQELSCFVLDNNAYIVVSDDLADAGNFFGEVRPDIMAFLVEDYIYRKTPIFDYQAICYEDKKKATEPQSSSPKMSTFYQHMVNILKWLFTTLIYFINAVVGKQDDYYESVKPYTIGYNRLQLNKTVPTPCDHKFWLFTLNRTSYTHYEKTAFTRKECVWPYMVQAVPGSNLIFLVVNGLCKENTTQAYQFTPDHEKIEYNISHPCYIATRNNFYKRPYIKCFNSNEKEFSLNRHNPERYCGSFKNFYF